MSCKILCEVMRHSFKDPIKKLIMIFLAEGSCEQTYAYPLKNYKLLSEQCEITESELMKNLKDLEESQIIRIFQTTIQIL